MFLTRSKKDEVVLIVDVGNSSVGGALALLSKEQNPKVLYTFRSNIIWHEPPEQGHFLIGITQALEHVVSHITNRGLHFVPKNSFGRMPVHKSYTIFSSPWYLSQTKILKIDDGTPVLVTNHLVDQLIKDEEKKFTDEGQSGSYSMIFKNAEIVERRVIRISLNGYVTPDPFGKKASNIEVAFFASLISKDILDSVNKIIDGHFHIRHRECSTFPLAAFTAFAGVMPKIQDFLVVDVRGELTDIALVRSGTLINTLSFPQGKNSLIRAVAESSGQSFHTAFSSLKIALHNHGTPEFQESIKKLTEPFKVSWMASYTKTIKEISENNLPPKTIFLVSDPEMEILFENIFDETAGAVELHPLKRSQLRSYVNISSSFSDPFLALEAIFVNQL